MKRMLSLFVAILALGCNAQETKNKAPKDSDLTIDENPKGSWKVNREFDEAGNLIRYDSIYSYSSDDTFKGLSTIDQDSLIQSMRSRFDKHFKGFGWSNFDDLYPQDSLLDKDFFNEDFFDTEFGKDFMQLDQMHERMDDMHQRFMERYRSAFKRRDSLVEPK